MLHFIGHWDKEKHLHCLVKDAPVSVMALSTQGHCI